MKKKHSRFKTILLFFLLLLSVCLPRFAYGRPKLSYKISSCRNIKSNVSTPSPKERAIATKLKSCGTNMTCRKKLLMKLPKPLRNCYIQPKRPPESRETCLKEARRKPYVEVSGRGKDKGKGRGAKGSLFINQRLVTYCNAKSHLTFRLSKKKRTLILTERFNARRVPRCVCAFDIQATIKGLSKGPYTLKIVFDNRYAGKKEVTHTVGAQLE